MARNAYTTISRTGTSRGKVYNGSGDNLTAYPAGAGNVTVGTWQRDFSTLAGGTWNYDGEFSGILADGRLLARGGQDQYDLPDFDGDEGASDRGSVLVEGDKWAHITSAHVRLMLTCPLFSDAGTWLMDASGETPLIEPNVPDFQLDTWLDKSLILDWEWPDPDTPSLGPLRNKTWDAIRHWLRVPINWAVYRVPLAASQYEGYAEWINENGYPGTAINASPMAYGPFGMLTAMYGLVYARTHSTKLWELSEGLKPIVRGELDVPYAAYGYDEQFSGPDVMYGVALNDDPPPTSKAVTTGGVLDTPAQRARGRIIELNIQVPDMEVRENEIIVWHVQTGITRLRAQDEPGGAGDPDLVIAQPTFTGGGFDLGPFMGLVYQSVTARYRSG